MELSWYILVVFGLVFFAGGQGGASTDVGLPEDLQLVDVLLFESEVFCALFGSHELPSFLRVLISFLIHHRFSEGFHPEDERLKSELTQLQLVPLVLLMIMLRRCCQQVQFLVIRNETKYPCLYLDRIL